MSNASFWDSERVKFKHMPTLQDALCACDRETLMRVLLDDKMTYALRQLNGGHSKAARKRLASTLDVMQTLSLDEKANRDRVLFPCESFVLQCTSLHIVRHLGAVVVLKGDLPLARSALARLKGGHDLEVGDDIAHDYTLWPWEETLATKVWLAGPWCRRERYEALAAAFWEMTYFGFEYERAHARMMHEKTTRFVGDGQEPDAGSCRGLTVSDVKHELSSRMDLVEPDRFQLDYREKLIRCVADLNRTARIGLYDRVIDWERRMEKD